MQHGVEVGRLAGPILRQCDPLAHLRRQAVAQHAGIGRPQRAAAHGQHGGQLQQPGSIALGAGRCQAQHPLARQHGIQVGLAGGAGQGPPGAGGRLRGGPVAGLHQVVPALALRPGLQGQQRGRGLCIPWVQRKTAHGRLGGRAGRMDRPRRSAGRAVHQQAQQVQRTAGFGAGARQAFTAEGLHPHHRADDVAVDIQVAGAHGLHHLHHRLVDAGVHAAGQAVAGGVDLGQQRGQGVAVVAQQMQHRAENLALQLGQVLDLDQGGGDEVAWPGGGLSRAGAIGQRLPDRPAQRTQGGNVALDAAAGLGVDHRADIGGQ